MKTLEVSRRALLKLGLMSGAATLIGSAALRPMKSLAALPRDTGCGVLKEAFPTSPVILEPFRDELPIPKALAPVPSSEVGRWRIPPGPTSQSSSGDRHQIWPSQLALPEPVIYQVKVQVSSHSFTSSRVQPIDRDGLPVFPPDGIAGPRNLPASTIYGFNGTFPGPMITAEYGRPVLVRFENELHLNPQNLDRNDFGSPDWAFLTHLHNGHTAPESDGNPHYRPDAYQPEEWCDNLYLNWPPDGDSNEKQSFFWFHDHRMDHTGANVYKGLVGLYPIYDPLLDPGNEANRSGLRLPGIRTDNPDGSFDVKYDIPLALYDCSLDDGVTPHADEHNGCGESHPEWWGQTFFRHYPNHGFVGDMFTVNGTAYPVLRVKRRKYRFRFLDASVARIYELTLMSSRGGPKSAVSLGHTGDGLQGQYRLPDGQQCMRFTQIAADGGLLPVPLVRNSFELWPAKRREFIVDFSRYMDGTPTTRGDAIYLVNVKQMSNGRKPDEAIDDDTGLPNPDFDPNYRVPILKIVIDGNPPEPDLSVMPGPRQPLRRMPSLPLNLRSLPRRRFTLKRGGGFGPEVEWLINGLPFDPLVPLATPREGSGEVWTIENGGGGWVHPLHIHQEEHTVLSRNGVRAPDRNHPDDSRKEDVIALEPGEEVEIYRKFRTFTGPYVAHCHNLAHEDHAMMFGWKIV
jgi:FtsP/CotA-like multicopper oxidase with cupredoxin domain